MIFPFLFNRVFLSKKTYFCPEILHFLGRVIQKREGGGVVCKQGGFDYLSQVSGHTSRYSFIAWSWIDMAPALGESLSHTKEITSSVPPREQEVLTLLEVGRCGFSSIELSEANGSWCIAYLYFLLKRVFLLLFLFIQVEFFFFFFYLRSLFRKSNY